MTNDLLQRQLLQPISTILRIPSATPTTLHEVVCVAVHRILTTHPNLMITWNSEVSILGELASTLTNTQLAQALKLPGPTIVNSNNYSLALELYVKEVGANRRPPLPLFLVKIILLSTLPVQTNAEVRKQLLSISHTLPPMECWQDNWTLHCFGQVISKLVTNLETRPSKCWESKVVKEYFVSAAYQWLPIPDDNESGSALQHGMQTLSVNNPSLWKGIVAVVTRLHDFYVERQRLLPWYDQDLRRLGFYFRRFLHLDLPVPIEPPLSQSYRSSTPHSLASSPALPAPPSTPPFLPSLPLVPHSSTHQPATDLPTMDSKMMVLNAMESAIPKAVESPTPVVCTIALDDSKRKENRKRKRAKDKEPDFHEMLVDVVDHARSFVNQLNEEEEARKKGLLDEKQRIELEHGSETKRQAELEDHLQQVKRQMTDLKAQLKELRVKKTQLQLDSKKAAADAQRRQLLLSHLENNYHQVEKKQSIPRDEISFWEQITSFVRFLAPVVSTHPP